MKVTVIGTGYVGLVTGACLSEMGNHVVCLDVDEHKIRILNDGGIPIHEPGLKEIVQRNVAAGRLQFTTDVAAAVAHGTIQFIGVGTPVVVGSGPLVWDGGTDLFVRAGWMLRERLGQDVALVWVGRPGHDLELTQLRHDIGHMGLDGHVHLLLGPDDGEALWLGDVHLVTSRLPETPLLHVPGASRGQALVAWEAPLLRRFTGGDAARMIDFLDMAGLAQATADLLVDDDARAALGARALGRYRDWHEAEDRPSFLLRMLREAR